MRRKTKLPHLLERDGVFYFRAAVPLTRRRVWANLTEMKLSLRTKDRGRAKLLCRDVSNAFERLVWSTPRMSNLTLDQIKQYAREHLQAALNKAHEAVVCIAADPVIDIDLELEGYRAELAQLQDRWRRRDVRAFQEDAAQLLLSRVPAHMSVDLEDIAEASAALMRAAMQERKYMIGSLEGDPSKTSLDDPWFVGLQPNEMPDPDGRPYRYRVTFREATQKFTEARRRGWVGKTAADYERTFGWAIDVIGGGRLLKDVNTEDVRAFRDALARIPANMTKFAEFDGKSLLEISSKRHNHDPISEKTQDKYFGMLKSFLKWAYDEELIDRQPGKSVRVVPGPKGSGKHRRSFTDDELSAIFSSPLFTGCQSERRRSTPGRQVIMDAYYWVPIVALCSGMRMGEIIQLKRSDIREHKGVRYFDINAHEDKTLKTEASARQVPISKTLVELGFDRFLASRRLRKESRLFYEIDAGADGYFSHNFSKWWTYYTRSIGTHRPGETTFHSFRHTFKDALKEADVPQELSMALMGHTDNSVHAGYGSGPSLEKLSEAVNRASFGVDLETCLCSSNNAQLNEK